MITALENKTTIPAQLDGEFKALLTKTFSSEPEWLKVKRKTAWEKFSDAGIPGRKNESYKYTDVKKIFSGKFTALHNESHRLAADLNSLFIVKDSIRLIFVNGWLHKDSTLSAKLPTGVVVGNLATDGLLKHAGLLQKFMSDNGDVLAQLNSALWTDGAFVYLPENTKLEAPVEIVHISTGNEELLASPRHLVVAEKGSAVNIIEHSLSLELRSNQIINAHIDVQVAENATVRLYQLQSAGEQVSEINSLSAVQETTSHFDTNTISVGAAWVRNNLNIALNGAHSEAHLNGLFITSGTTHLDNHTAVWHNQPNCQSNQLYKGILDGRSTGIFNGKIFVERDAQKTNAYQSSKNILLSDDATINTKPELEIYADDVKCSHGSSTGKIDENALFYLRSRGLSEESARRLLLSAFANDVLNTIKIDAVRSYLEELVAEKLSS